MKRKDTFARAAFTIWAMLVAAMAICNSRVSSDGWYFTALMGIVSTLLLADLVVNDLMPDRFVFNWAMEWRKWTYTLASFSYASHLFVAEQSSRSVHIDTLFIYGSMALFGLMLSFRNLFHVRGRACSEQ